jgi:pyruvate/2-oxoglutarate/acetoin dehydrogenase E1 component
MTTFLGSIQQGLADAFRNDARVHLVGEDILDPYGGAFKASKGLSSSFPDRVTTSPISEAGIVALGTGMALRGLRPVIEIMFGDFMTLAADQVINHATKFRGMYAQQVTVPLVIRTPVGGGRGYGATHSQCLEKMFLGCPGLSVVAPSHLHDPGDLLEYAILRDDDPTLFLEHKLLYPMQLREAADSIALSVIEEVAGYPTMHAANFISGRPDVLVIAYGGMSREVVPVLERMSHEEIRVAALFPSSLQPLPVNTIADAARRVDRVLVVEEGSAGFNWGSEVAALVYHHRAGALAKPIERLASRPTVIPTASHLERQVLPGQAQIEQSILRLLS